MKIKINKEVRQILDEILKWDKWLKQRVGHWKKDGDCITKEIRNWKRRLKQSQTKSKNKQ